MGARQQPRKPGRRMNREELTRHQRETRAQQTLMMVLGGVTLFVILMLGFGWWRTYVARGSESVATVAGASISMAASERGIRTRSRSSSTKSANIGAAEDGPFEPAGNPARSASSRYVSWTNG